MTISSWLVTGHDILVTSIMYKLIAFCLALGFLMSCGSKNKSEEITTDSASMDSILITKKMDRIKGSSGFLFVNDGGTGGIPILFAHSFGGDNTHWKNQLEHLRTHRRAIAFDFRGAGQSDFPSDNNYSAEALASDIAAVADSLGLDRFILVGHSMGGSAAIAYAASHPERIAGLIVEGTPGRSDEKQARMIVASLQSDKYQQVMDDYMKQLTAGAKPEVDSAVNKGVKKISKEATVKMVKTIFDYNPLPDLIKYNGPRLIIATTREEQQPNSLMKQAPEVPRKVIDGTSHWIQLDKPEEFNKILDEFINSIESKLTM